MAKSYPMEGWMLVPKHRGTVPLKDLIIAASLACIENRLMDADDRHELAQYADQLQHTPASPVASEREGLTDERTREIALQYCVYDKETKQYDVLRYECEEDFFGFARALLTEQSAAPQKLCSICHGYGRYQDGDSGTESDGYAPNIVECECSPEERFPRASEQADEAVMPMTQAERDALPDWVKNARPPEAV